MDQISRLIFDVQGRDRGGSKVLDDASVKADNAHQSLSRLGDTLSNLGGPFGAVSNAAGEFGGALDTLQERGRSFTGVLTGIGLGLTAAGVTLIGFADKEKQARVQLENAIKNTGAAYSDYQGQVEESVKSEERFGHAADDTMAALTRLTIASQDPTKALRDLSLVTEIAATKHESLADAAQQLIGMEEGSTRAFKAFGIVLDGQGTKTQQIDRALKDLSDRLSGSASAAASTYEGRLKAIQARTEDFLGSAGRYGEWVTAVGGAITTVTALYELLAASKARNVAADEALIGTETQLAAAQTRVAASATAENIAIGRRGMLGGLGPAALLKGGAFVAGGYFAGQLASAAAGGGNTGGLLSSGLTGAGIGAGLGSILPGPGTLAGAAIGAGLGIGAHFLFGGGGSNNNDALAAIAATPGGAADIRRLLALNKAVNSGQVGFSELGKDSPRFDFTQGLTKTQVNELTDATDDQLRKALEATKANREYATALLKEADAANKATISIDGQIKALRDGVGAASGFSQAEDDMSMAMHNLAQSVHDGSNALQGHSLAAEANRNALRDAVNKLLDLIQAQKQAGASALTVRETAVEAAKALRQQAIQVIGNRDAVDEFLRRLGVLPRQIAQVLGATELYSEQVGERISEGLAAGIDAGAPAAVQAAERVNAKIGAAIAGKMLHLDQSDPAAQGSLVPKDSKAIHAAEQTAKDVADTFVNNYAPVVDDGVDQATADALQRAKSRLDQAEQEIFGTYRRIRDSIIGGFDIASLPQHTDALGFTGGVNDPRKAAHQFVQQLEEWANLLGRLRRKGLNETMLEQLEAAGIAAIPVMREILRQHEIHPLNRAERKIRGIGRQVSADFTSDQYGEEIARLLNHLPHKLAVELAKELRHLKVITDTELQDVKQGHKVTAG